VCLLEYGCPAAVESKNGSTPLDIARSLGFEEIAVSSRHYSTLLRAAVADSRQQSEIAVDRFEPHNLPYHARKVYCLPGFSPHTFPQDILASKESRDQDPFVPKFRDWLHHLGAGEYIAGFLRAGYDLPFIAKQGYSHRPLSHTCIPFIVPNTCDGTFHDLLQVFLNKIWIAWVIRCVLLHTISYVNFC